MRPPWEPVATSEPATGIAILNPRETTISVIRSRLSGVADASVFASTGDRDHDPSLRLRDRVYSSEDFVLGKPEF